MPTACTTPIDWGLLSRGVEFYRDLGYAQIEVPWVVRPEVTRVTLPPFAKPFATREGDLVGSAEQAFIQMMLDGSLPPGRYMAVSPCFRDEPVLDHLHHKHFMKVELINTFAPDVGSMRAIITHAMSFFGQVLPTLRVVDVSDNRGMQFDIESEHGYELGSYGVRHHGHLAWAYGTGIAEPRLSHVLTLEGAW